MSAYIEELFTPVSSRVLVTGGTSGLGHAIAEAFIRSGVDTAVCSRHPEAAGDLAELASREGGNFTSLFCDITDEESVSDMLSSLEESFGPVLMLVNSAGMNILKPAEDYDAASFDRVMDLNIRGMHIVCSQTAKRFMIPAGLGRIVNISSAKSFLATDRNYAAYCASKGAVNMYTKQLAVEWAKFGIRVNAIAPTFVRTPINAFQLEDPEFYAKVVGHIPVGRLGRGEDIAAAALFLCSEASDFVTGVTLRVDGGCTSMQ